MTASVARLRAHVDSEVEHLQKQLERALKLKKALEDDSIAELLALARDFDDALAAPAAGGRQKKGGRTRHDGLPAVTADAVYDAMPDHPVNSPMLAIAMGLPAEQRVDIRSAFFRLRDAGRIEAVDRGMYRKLPPREDADMGITIRRIVPAEPEERAPLFATSERSEATRQAILKAVGDAADGLAAGEILAKVLGPGEHGKAAKDKVYAAIHKFKIDGRLTRDEEFRYHMAKAEVAA